MTQMGLEYAKLQEQQRHNKQDEGIRAVANALTSQDVKTRAYTASFKPQEIAIESRKAGASEASAQASQRQAGVAERKQSLDERYRERETKVKESQAESASKQASASESQAESAAKNAETKVREQDLKELQNILANLPQVLRETWGQENMYGSDPVTQALAPLASILDRIIPNFSVRASFK